MWVILLLPCMSQYIHRAWLGSFVSHTLHLTSEKEESLGMQPKQSLSHSCCHGKCIQYSSIHSACNGGGCICFSFSQCTGLESCRTHTALFSFSCRLCSRVTVHCVPLLSPYKHMLFTLRAKRHVIFPVPHKHTMLGAPHFSLFYSGV